MPSVRGARREEAELSVFEPIIPFMLPEREDLSSDYDVTRVADLAATAKETSVDLERDLVGAR